jgi:hypothetical protein
MCVSAAGNARDGTRITASNPTIVISNDDWERCKNPGRVGTAWAVIQAIEAAQMIRKGQVNQVTRNNQPGQAWVFGALLGLA